MAAYDPEEREQIDELKAWWERYGSAITAGLILGLLVIAGVQGWRWWNGKRAEDASVLYTAVSDAVRAKDAAKAKDAALSITDRYGSTSYAPRAALLYAKLLYDTGDRSGAKAQYQWVVDHAREDEVRAIGRYRLAQVQIDEKQYDAALATIDAIHPESFDGLYADLRGDALAAAGRGAEARTAYETALAKLDPKSPYRSFVQVKHDALGGVAKAPEIAAAEKAASEKAATEKAATEKAATEKGATGPAAPGKAATGAAK
jgi:predicted negative regulator of RcsB-dependent stress response